MVFEREAAVENYSKVANVWEGENGVIDGEAGVVSGRQRGAFMTINCRGPNIEPCGTPWEQ